MSIEVLEVYCTVACDIFYHSHGCGLVALETCVSSIFGLAGHSSLMCVDSVVVTALEKP